MTAEVLTLMYHRVTDNDNPLDARTFESHLKMLIEHYPIVVPSDKLHPSHLNLCLTFDDAYFDFYQFVFPILKKYNTKAILGVPTAYILDDAKHVLISERLSVPYPQGMKGKLYETLAPFCSYAELREMVQSGLVELASHSHSHRDFTELTTPDLKDEIERSKRLLEEKCQTKVKHFIYPYGNTNAYVHEMIRPHFDNIFKIGSAINRGWETKSKILYRVDAQQFWENRTLWSKSDLRKYRLKHWFNRLRNK